MPLAPNLSAVWTAFFMARRKAMRRSSWVAMFSATSCASVSAFRTSTTFRKTSLSVRAWRSFLMVSMPAPALADDDARTSGVDVDLHLVGGPLDLDLGDAGLAELLLHELTDLDVLVQPLGVVLLLVPGGLPGPDDPETEPDRMDFLPHVVLLARALTRAPRCRAPRRRGSFLSMRVARPMARGMKRRVFGAVVHGERLHEQRVHVDAAALVLGVGHGRPEQLGQVRRGGLRRELEHRQGGARPACRARGRRPAGPCAAVTRSWRRERGPASAARLGATRRPCG